MNPTFQSEDGVHVPRQTISIRRTRFANGTGLRERIGFYNCNQFPVSIALTVEFDADFLDMFASEATRLIGAAVKVQFGSQPINWCSRIPVAITFGARNWV